MTYCLLEDAWGADKITKEFEQYNLKHNTVHDIEEKKSCSSDKYETFVNSESKNYKINYNNNSNKTEHNSSLSCDDIIEHFKNCKECSNKINKNKPFVLDSMKELINDNRDVIVLILIGISILLFFNLINNLTKN